MSVFVIAEIGVNHNGSLDMALQLVDAAAEAGVDAVKFQTFQAEKGITKNAPKADYQIQTTGKGQSQLDMLRQLELGAEDHYKLKKRCDDHGICFLSTPSDGDCVDLLTKGLGLDTLKISSGVITHGPFLLKIAKTGCFIILSTGMSTLGEIEDALGVIAFGLTENETLPSREAFRKAFFSKEGQDMLQKKVTLLHCTTEYPAPFHEVNLRAMGTLRQAFALPVGYSDHTEGIAVPIAAAALGAEIIEKHFTLDKTLPGPDHKASVEPAELLTMVKGIREVEVALGSSRKIPTSSEIINLPVVRPSLTANEPIKKGGVLTETNITVKRPGFALSPMFFWDCIGKKTKKEILKDEQLLLNMVDF